MHMYSLSILKIGTQLLACDKIHCSRKCEYLATYPPQTQRLQRIHNIHYSWDMIHVACDRPLNLIKFTFTLNMWQLIVAFNYYHCCIFHATRQFYGIKGLAEVQIWLNWIPMWMRKNIRPVPVPTYLVLDKWTIYCEQKRFLLTSLVRTYTLNLCGVAKIRCTRQETSAQLMWSRYERMIGGSMAPDF